MISDITTRVWLLFSPPFPRPEMVAERICQPEGRTQNSLTPRFHRSRASPATALRDLFLKGLFAYEYTYENLLYYYLITAKSYTVIHISMPDLLV